MKTITLSQKFIKFFVIILIALPMALATVKAFSGDYKTPFYGSFYHEDCKSCGSCLIWCDTFLIFNDEGFPVHKDTGLADIILYDAGEISDFLGAYQFCPGQCIFW